MFRKKIQKLSYDRENLRPVIRASICTGERVVGFRNCRTGQFSEVMLIRDRRDLELFLEMYGIEKSEVLTQW